MPVFSSRPPDAGPSDVELAASGVPDTSPTWELELLISGAVLFALFQIPPLLNGFFARVEPQATSTMLSVLLFVELYVKAIVYALTASFVVHLVARAYWVGLVGLHSVFPKGVRWENFKSGPMGLEVYKERLVSLPAIISRTDNFCSVIFSFAFLLVLLFAFTVCLTSIYSLVAFGIAQAFLGGKNTDTVFLVLAGLTAVVPGLTTLVDRRFGARLGPRGQRVVRRLVIFAYRGTAQGVISPIFVPLLTNVGRKKIMAIFYCSLFGVLLFVIGERLARNDQLAINNYDYFGSSSRFGVDYRFYESQRDPGDIYGRVPSIQSDIITGSYVKLFIPYYPRRYNDAVAKSCPALHPIQSRGLQIGSDTPVPDSLAIPVLECLGRIHGVTVDGAPRPDLQYRFYEHPGTGVKGVITYIPADSLTRGQHLITVRQVPSADASPTAPAPPAWVIPFWR
ncbi:MAG TPA: hypothetical protein VJW73_13520 [Gemmatimonadaceae bacterium]|nr:hypothetical protein [Gemmatimonadaceae bacterium]